MKKKQNLISFLVYTCVMFILSTFFASAQNMQVDILGGATVTDGSTVSITAGSAVEFDITNVRSNCGNVKIEDITLSNNTEFSITYTSSNLPQNIKASHCSSGVKNIYFTVTNISSNCSASTDITIENNQDSPDFSFTLSMGSSPEIYVIGGSPSADIYHGDTTTSDTNGTYFGVVDEGATVTRQYVVTNIGSCDLAVTALATSNSDFAVSSPYPIPYAVASYGFMVIDVDFTAPALSGTQTSVISISNNDNTTFTFTVSAEMFNYSIPGPGGVTADFRLWLKSTRGITESSGSVTDWLDVGTNLKSATTDLGNEPSYLDTLDDNINFNPVIQFENDGGSVNQYMYNSSNGFYSEDIFIVMIPDAAMSNVASKSTIFSGVDTETTGDVTGIGFGDYSSEFTNEVLSYNKNIPGGTFYGTAETSTSKSYSNVGIINVTNDSDSSPSDQEILYNSVTLTTSTTGTFSNVSGSKYWIGKNYEGVGSLNGRVAEIFTFASKLDAGDRQKIESYLAIKYGITLGTSNEATKDYMNSFSATPVWDVSANLGYNHHVAGIGRDDDSDLNQKQSKTVNTSNEVTIGLGGLFDINSDNTNEFNEDGDFLVWGCNDASFSGVSTNTVTIASGITTSLTRMDRKWKIVESIKSGSGGDVENVYLGIPETAFSSFSLGTDEEYALVVSDSDAFGDADIIDVIPLKISTHDLYGTPILDKDGNQVYKTWYDFEGTKYFTFAKVSKFSENHSMTIVSGDYLVGEYLLNLNTDSFTISTWIKCAANASNRTVMAKGEKLQIRLNTSGNIEVYIDDAVTPKYTSDMEVDDGKWHHTTFVYDSATLFMYFDGVLDKSVPNIVHPSPNSNHYTIGALYKAKDDISNYLLGEIDEVYVWDIALTQAQIRYLMNQEVERLDISGTDYVAGKILPYDASSNGLQGMPWADLRAYYDFNSFYGSTTEGKTDERYFLRLNYLDKTKALVDDQTAPLPYVTASGGATWDTASTWSNNADQVIPNSLALDGTTMIDWNIVQLDHSISSGDRDISILGLTQTTGTLTIADPTVTAFPEDNAGQALTVSHYLELDGVIDLVGESQLIQTEGSIIDADSGGYIERDQQGTANGFNYNYWSSSVGPIVSGVAASRGTGVSATNTSHTITTVLKNGTDSDGYVDLSFDTAYTPYSGSTTPPGLSRTISSYWLYKFYGPANDYDAWISIDETSSLSAGEGFTMKGTSGSVAITDEQNYVFKGLPYNGDVTLVLDSTSEDKERLIGNPYPSAIDATEFILDNLSTTDGGNNTETVINGALYFWDHFGEENSHSLGAYVGGYATRNLLTGAEAISNDARINNTSDGGSPAEGTKIPGEYIAVNQGFFVSTEVKTGLLDNNGVQIDPIDGGTIIFKNSQRIYATEDGSTSLFLKSSSKKDSSANSESDNDTPIIKLMFDSPKGYHRQIVLGVNDFASDGFDMGYDALMVDVNEEDMYWDFSDNKFVIQGVNNLNSTQEFSLGVVVKESGLIVIKIDELENIDSNLPIYIKDEVTGQTHQINSTSFEIDLEAGTYNDRFKLVFQAASGSLSTGGIETLENVLLYYDTDESEIVVKKDLDTYISEVIVYNLLGQELQVLEVNSTLKHITVPTKIDTGIYIFKLNTENGFVNRKVIIK
ncbi:MAG: LamG-like jellyroll fold domain-containing protein [Algibacter sp.]